MTEMKCGLRGVGIVALLCAVALTAVAGGRTGDVKGLKLLEEFSLPAIECEVAGIHPHPTQPALYFIAANRTADCRAGQKPLLPAEHRGKLLLMRGRTGEVVRTYPLTGGQYGGIAYGGGHLFVSALNPPEILKVNTESGDIVDRIPVSGPVGGLEYDRVRDVLLAQLYVSHPHLAVVDPKRKTTVGTLWCDETAMDLKRVRGDLLCSWASGFDAAAFSELRLLDPSTGRVKGRLRLDGVYTSMAPLDKAVAGVDGFLALVKVDNVSGRVVVRKHEYDRQAVNWR